MSSAKLLSCPFCGGAAQVCGDIDELRYGVYVACTSADCYCALGECYDGDAMPEHAFATEADAVAAWNSRKGN